MAMHVNETLADLVPGVGTVNPTCGFQPHEPACQLALLNYRPELAGVQPLACGFGVDNLDCFKARANYRKVKR